MAGEVRNVKVRLSVENAQAIAGLKQTGDAADQVAGRMERAGTRGGRSLDVIGKASRNTAIAGGVALAAIEKANLSFDKQMSSVDAATHETARNMGLLRSAAIKAGADTQFSATEAASGITELAKAGVKTKAILGGGLKGALDLAAAGQISVGEAAETAASAMTQFRLKGKDVPHIADLLAAGAGKAQGSVHDLGQALNQSGLVASQTGLSIEETTGTLASFAKAGLTGSDAGTSFKTMLLSLNPRSKEAAALMKKYNIEAYDAQGNFVGITKYAGKLKDGLKDLTSEQRQRAFSKIFGTDAIRAANILYRNGARGTEQWKRNVDDAGYAADTARRQTNNLAGDWERFTGSLESAFIKSGGGAQGGLRSLVQGAEDLVDKFSALPGAVQGNVVKAVAALTGLAGGVYIATKAVKGFQAVKSILPGAAKGGPLGAVAKASGVVPVFVTNEGFGGGVPGKGGAAPIVTGAGAPAAKAGRFAAVAGGARLVGTAALVGLVGAAVNQQVQSVIRAIGARGNESGILSDFKKPKSAGSAFLFGQSHTVQKDLKAASSATRFGGVGAKADQFLAGLVGGDALSKSLANVKKLDAALSSLTYKDANAGANQFKRVVEESGLSVEKLNKVLPRTAEAMKSATKGGGDGFKEFESALGRVFPQIGRYGKVLNTLPKDLRTYVSTPGAINSMDEMRNVAKVYKLTPKQIRTIMQLQGFSQTQARIVAAGRAYTSLPKAVKTAISTPGAIKSEGDVKKLQRRYNLTPRQVRTIMQVSGVDAQIAKVRALQAAIAAVRGKSVTIETVIRRRAAGNTNIAVPKADGGTIEGPLYPYGDKVLIHAAPGEEIITNRHGEADRFRADRASGRIPAYADGGTVAAAVTGGVGTTAVSVIFPSPAILKASVVAANQVATAAAYTARSAADTRTAHLDDLHAQQRIRDLAADLRRHETTRVRGHDGHDDNKSKKGMQDNYRNVRRLAVRGLDRKVAAAELRDARAELAETRRQVATAAAAALTEARTAAAESLRGGLEPVRSPASAIRSVEKLSADIAAYGNTMARLKAANASPALLAYVKQYADNNDFRSANRLGQALLNQPAALGQLNTSLATLGSVSGNIAQLTTDPRFTSAKAWNPTGTVVQQSQVLLQADPSTWMTELVARTKAAVMTEMGVN